MEPKEKGELIVFKKGPEGDWGNSGEWPSPEADVPPPRPRLLLLPVLLLLDGLAIVLAVVGRPVAASVLLAGAAAAWAVLRDGAGIGHDAALGLLLAVWAGAQFLRYDVDRLVERVETAESRLMRAAYARGRRVGRALHLALYLSVAVMPGVIVALLSGLLRTPSWVPESLRPGATFGVLHPIPVILLAVLLGVAAVALRSRWHPVARHATLLGTPRKLAVVAGGAEAPIVARPWRLR